MIQYTDYRTTGGNPKVLGSYDRRMSILSVPLHPDDVKILDKNPEYVEIGDKVIFKKVKLNPLGREVDPMNLTQNQSGCVWYGKLIPEIEDERNQHVIEVIKIDEELDSYNENSPGYNHQARLVKDLVKEIKLEDVFNDEKREKVKQVIQQHKVLTNLSLVNPLHLQMTSNGHGEFPDGYKLTEKGIQYIIEQLNKE